MYFWMDLICYFAQKKHRKELLLQKNLLLFGSIIWIEFLQFQIVLEKYVFYQWKNEVRLETVQIWFNSRIYFTFHQFLYDNFLKFHNFFIVLYFEKSWKMRLNISHYVIFVSTL